MDERGHYGHVKTNCELLHKQTVLKVRIVLANLCVDVWHFSSVFGLVSLGQILPPSCSETLACHPRHL